MNFDEQVRTSTGDTVQAPIWGRTGRKAQLVHLYNRKEIAHKTGLIFSPSAIKSLHRCTSSGSSIQMRYRTGREGCLDD